MLGPNSFNFETPNVIDPGDEAPGAPTRQEKQQKPWETDKKNKKDTQPLIKDGIFTNKNKRVSKRTPGRGVKIGSYAYSIDESMFGGGSEDDDDYDDDLLSVGGYEEDEKEDLPGDEEKKEEPNYEFHNKSQQRPEPTAADTRLFAATMLAETERRNSKRGSGYFNSKPNSNRNLMARETVPLANSSGFHGKTVRLDIPQNQPKDYRTFKRRFCFIIMLTVIFSFAASVSIAIKNISNRRGGVSNRMETIVSLLSTNQLSNIKDLNNKDSPQHKAAMWIANHDPMQVDIPPTNLNDGEDYSPFIQRYALAVFFYALGGENWSDQLQFVTEEHECGWFLPSMDDSGDTYAIGVTCDTATLQVKELLLPRNNLKGQIPNEIQLLSHLDFMSLMHNEVSGTIPTTMSKLTLLDYLDLKFNQMSGKIPEFLGNLDKLQVLGLSHNRFDGTIPESLGSLTQLETFAVDDNLLTGDIGPISLMTNLQYLYAENNDFDGHLDQDGGLLAELERLREVDLSGNALQSSQIPAYLFDRLPQLRILDLSDNELKGTIPPTVPTNDELHYFSVRFNQLDGSIPDSISNLRTLTHLDLEGNAFGGEMPGSIGSIHSLTYLALGKNIDMTSGPIPAEYQNLNQLKELSLDATNRNGAIPTWIPERLSQLKYLDLRINALTGSIPVGFGNLNDLGYLLLSDNTLVGSIPDDLTQLEGLSALAIHKNGITGDATDLCDAASANGRSFDILTTDCGDITCPCCDSCCDGDTCFDGLVWEYIEHEAADWEKHFENTDYGFNPHILSQVSDMSRSQRHDEDGISEYNHKNNRLRGGQGGQ